MTISVNLDEETALDMLMDRLEVWNPDFTEQRLYKQMYEAYIDGDCFDGSDFDPKKIVDNDWVNDCNVISLGDEEYEGIAELYDEHGIKAVLEANPNMTFKEWCEREYPNKSYENIVVALRNYPKEALRVVIENHVGDSR